MLFSTAFGITKKDNDEWFDPILNCDTNLFIDPFLVQDFEFGCFIGAHKEVCHFFDYAAKRVAQSGGNTSNSHWNQALSLLRFPEVEELCLGYTAIGTAGQGSGRRVARQLSSALWKAISAGMESVEHFEELQLFEEGVGPDRISDAFAGIIRHRLAKYTLDICRRHDIPVAKTRYERGRFDEKKERFINLEFLLPINPINSKPILLVPRRYLRQLPSINAAAFWEYCYDHHFDGLRERFGEDISKHIDKEKIVELARAARTYREEYVRHTMAKEAQPYDLESDPSGLYQSYVKASQWTSQNPVTLQISDSKALKIAAAKFIDVFQNYVENEGGWELLWNDSGKPKPESAFQKLFFGIVSHYCRANNIDVSPETNIGRGPVDFKMSVGHNVKVLIEAKLAKSTKFWSGLEKQLVKYLEAERVDIGFYLVCAQREADLRRVQDIQKRVSTLRNKVKKDVRCVVIDARLAPPSASTL